VELLPAGTAPQAQFGGRFTAMVPAVLDVQRALVIPYAAPREFGRPSTSRDLCALKRRGGYKCQGNGLTCVT
jgi:hypothetical protein